MNMPKTMGNVKKTVHLIKEFIAEYDEKITVQEMSLEYIQEIIRDVARDSRRSGEDNIALSDSCKKSYAVADAKRAAYVQTKVDFQIILDELSMGVV